MRIVNPRRHLIMAIAIFIVIPSSAGECQKPDGQQRSYETAVFIAIGVSVGVVGLGLTAANLIFKRGVWKGEVDSDRIAFKDFIEKVEKKLDAIFDRLPPPSTSPGSPVVLTDFGEKISEFIDGKVWASEIAVSILDEMADKEEFEIFKICGEIITRGDRPQLVKKVESCAYHFGTTDESVYSVLQVELRDAVLKLLDSCD